MILSARLICSIPNFSLAVACSTRDLVKPIFVNSSGDTFSIIVQVLNKSLLLVVFTEQKDRVTCFYGDLYEFSFFIHDTFNGVNAGCCCLLGNAWIKCRKLKALQRIIGTL